MWSQKQNRGKMVEFSVLPICHFCLQKASLDSLSQEVANVLKPVVAFETLRF